MLLVQCALPHELHPAMEPATHRPCLDVCDEVQCAEVHAFRQLVQCSEQLHARRHPVRPSAVTWSGSLVLQGADSVGFLEELVEDDPGNSEVAPELLAHV